MGTGIEAVDRAWWARSIARSGLADTEYYAAQRGWSFVTPSRAIADYVLRGHRAGFSLNPLVDELVAGRGLPEPDRVPALYAYLVSDRTTVSLHPWWDAPRAAGRSDTPALESVWRDRGASEIELQVGEVKRVVPVEVVRGWAIEAAKQWRAGRSVETAERTPERETVVVRLIQRRDRDYARRLTEVASLAPDHRVVIGAVGVQPSQWVGMDALARLVPGLGRQRVHARASYGTAVQACVPEDLGGALCVVGPRSDLTADQTRKLIAATSPGTAVAPAQLSGDGTIAAVGAAGTGARQPYRLLSGHPAEDLSGFEGNAVRTPLLSGPTFAVAGEDWRRGRGFRHDPGGDLALEVFTRRLRKIAPGFTCLVDTGIVSTAYAQNEVFSSRRRRGRGSFPDDRDRIDSTLARAGYEVTGWSSSLLHGVRPRLVWRRPDSTALRWAIKVSSPAGPAGAVWGDTHFADGLATALRDLGQTVVVDSFDARNRPTTYLDDVSVIVRGPYRISPPRTGLSIEWIISHPDKITRNEVRAVDLVYAASHRWSRRSTQRWGVPITPLLECTDAHRFFPRGLPRTDEVVFVGTSRGIARPSVVVPLAAGIPVRVYGPDWRTHIPPSAIVATSLPNDELSARYETASIVLNDQWPAMQREGFIAMRPFDAVAAGGRVISEYVEGIEDVFGDAVPVFRTPDDLLRLLREDPSTLFPDDEAIRAASDRIRRDHSFHSRATQLLAAVRLLADQDPPEGGR